jgi:small subunit ribosomal protein S9
MFMSTKATYHKGVGRRKRSSARAKIYENPTLEVSVNKKPMDQYFQGLFLTKLKMAIEQAGITTGKIDVFVRGGGQSGQSDAVKLAIAKATVTKDEGTRPILRLYNLLTTDIRKVLAKRPGKRKARKSEQWSKR